MTSLLAGMSHCNCDPQIVVHKDDGKREVF